MKKNETPFEGLYVLETVHFQDERQNQFNPSMLCKSTNAFMASCKKYSTPKITHNMTKRTGLANRLTFGESKSRIDRRKSPKIKEKHNA